MNLESSRLKWKVSRFFGYENAVLVGRARSGLVAVIEETTGPDAPIIIPSNTCSAVLAAVIAAGRKPLVVSVSATTGLVDDSELAGIVEAHEGSPGLAVVTHLYGMLADYPLTEGAARRVGWQLLENDSLAATAVCPPQRGYNVGQGLLLSFGHGKTLDGGGGGAILTNDSNLAASLAKRVARWAVFDQTADQIETSVVLARRHLVALGVPEGAEAVLPVEAAHCRHSFDYSWQDQIAGAIDGFQVENNRRMDRLEAWRTALADLHDELRVPPIPIRSAWRAIFTARGGVLRDRIVANLRMHGIDIGTNYPPLWSAAPKLLGAQRQASGDTWGACVITLWLSDTYDDPRIRTAADIIRKTIDMRRTHGFHE
jgi:dTDP-4-amino-4,6-dideoxygalactose transaminase